ncbi:MAG: SpoIID/LytB domain-containing protein [Eubacteriales bacterium]
MVRIVALILAVLMVGGMAYYTIYILTSSVGAADFEISEVLDTSSLKNSGDVLVRVGLMYGSNLTKGFEVQTTDGFTIGSQLLIDDRDFVELWDLDDTRISCTVDDNLSRTGDSYLPAEKKKDTIIGGYHIEVDCGDYERWELEELIEDLEDDLEDLGLYPIPSYINFGYALRIGNFASESDAWDYLDDVEDLFPRRSVKVVFPSPTAVSILSPDTDRILFEFDCEAELELGLSAHEDRNGNTYMQTPAGNIYDGVFCFKRYDNGDVEGVELINILPLEAYIAGVLPYETSNTWPLETLKAFAITVRSYTLSHLEKHMDVYGFDLCNTTECQVYKGAGRINERIMNAVQSTAGQILVYDDEIVNAYYSSSMGGVTVSAEDAWGGPEDLPYLQAVETPWERYMSQTNGFWIYEISPSALCKHLNQKGYTSLKDEIADVEILELAKNSTYVKELRITDIYGESVTITYTDNVRIALSPYVKSANFVVGQGSVEYTENVIVNENYAPEDDENEFLGQSTASYGKESGYTDVNGCYVITADSLERHYTSIWTGIATGEETLMYEKIDFFVMSSQNAAAFLGEEYAGYATVETEDKTENRYSTEILADKSDDDVVYKVAYAEDKDNFLFVGKGWGHGVGMSQYGARDLADLGYSAEEILYAYFTDVKIMDYEDFR